MHDILALVLGSYIRVKYGKLQLHIEILELRLQVKNTQPRDTIVDKFALLKCLLWREAVVFVFKRIAETFMLLALSI